MTRAAAVHRAATVSSLGEMANDKDRIAKASRILRKSFYLQKQVITSMLRFAHAGQGHPPTRYEDVRIGY